MDIKIGSHVTIATAQRSLKDAVSDSYLIQTVAIFVIFALLFFLLGALVK